jgi:hypothetical protein
MTGCQSLLKALKNIERPGISATGKLILSPTRLPIPPSRLSPILTDGCTDIIPTRVLKSSPTWLAILLLAVTIVVPLAGQDASVMTATARPAACHQHDGAPPSPQPVSYRCCRSGHDSAILQSTFWSQLDSSDQPASVERTRIFTLPSTLPIVRQVSASSADPPGLTALRI